MRVLSCCDILLTIMYYFNEILELSIYKTRSVTKSYKHIIVFMQIAVKVGSYVGFVNTRLIHLLICV